MTSGSSAVGTNAETMVGEAHHRFYNNLQIIMSITNAILRCAVGDPAVHDRIADLQDRVAQFAEINRLLSGPFTPELVSHATLAKLCDCIAAAFDRSATSITISAHGRIVSVQASRTLLLLVAELVTNAFKHGSRDAPLHISVVLNVSSQHCRLEVCNNSSGVGSVSLPRIASELAEAAGGILSCQENNGEFRVCVVLPHTGL
ncbi:histidine kinase dimerization/phosphoacceptor domain -containing protein [Sphingomonas sp. MMS12-HWE2-04]|uniref:histidine kinase dimerization/phosphoacceptor domain -containing protein n=1 Tax=Sphingomonas sp. MMS12-HWE2-04 TaxID=3234199 RepID=UPI00384BF4C7